MLRTYAYADLQPDFDVLLCVLGPVLGLLASKGPLSIAIRSGLLLPSGTHSFSHCSHTANIALAKIAGDLATPCVGSWHGCCERMPMLICNRSWVGCDDVSDVGVVFHKRGTGRIVVADDFRRHESEPSRGMFVRQNAVASLPPASCASNPTALA